MSRNTRASKKRAKKKKPFRRGRPTWAKIDELFQIAKGASEEVKALRLLLAELRQAFTDIGLAQNKIALWLKGDTP